MMTRTNLLVSTSVALLAMAGGVAVAASQEAAAAPTAAAATAAATPPRCTEEGLAGGLHGSQVGLGNYGFILTLTNTSNVSCSLYGYPGLGLQNARHQVLPSHTFWGSTYFDQDPGRALIVLSPGETVSADVAYSSDGDASHSVAATYLEVTPPNAVLHFTLRIPGAPVLISNGNVRATAVARHTPYGS